MLRELNTVLELVLWRKPRGKIRKEETYRFGAHGIIKSC